MDLYSTTDYNFSPNKRVCDIKPGDKNIDIKLIIVSQISRNKLKSDYKIITGYNSIRKES